MIVLPRACAHCTNDGSDVLGVDGHGLEAAPPRLEQSLNDFILLQARLLLREQHVADERELVQDLAS